MLKGAGPNALEKIFDLEPEQRGKVVHRAALLAELLRPIDARQMHTSKKVTKIIENTTSSSSSPSQQNLAIHFSDNTTFHADAIIGADGVHGHVRSHVLGTDHPATPAQRAGFWDARCLVAIEKAREILGGEFFEEQRQYGYLGNGGFFMHDGHDDGKMVQFVTSGMIENDGMWAEDEWSKPLDRVALEKIIKGWFVPELQERVVEVRNIHPFLYHNLPQVLVQSRQHKKKASPLNAHM